MTQRVNVTDETNVNEGKYNDVGYLGGRQLSLSETIPQSLRRCGNAHVSIVEDPDQGHACYCLSGQTEWGMIKVWLDPAQGFNAVRCEAKRVEGDKNSRGDALPSIVSGNNVHKRLTMTETSTVYNDVEYARVDGVWILTKCHLRGSTTYAELDEHDVSESWHERTAINVHPRAEGNPALNFNVPDGTPVFSPDQRGVKLVWRAGEIVPEVNADTIRSIDREVAKLRPASRPSK